MKLLFDTPADRDKTAAAAAAAAVPTSTGSPGSTRQAGSLFVRFNPRSLATDAMPAGVARGLMTKMLNVKLRLP
ncbi:MAG: hypothetical protein ACXVZX_13480 [Terriglobales bacterium]